MSEHIDITITAEEYRVTVTDASGVVIARHRHEMRWVGECHQVEGGLWRNEIDDSGLAEALEKLGRGPFHIACQLAKRFPPKSAPAPAPEPGCED